MKRKIKEEIKSKSKNELIEEVNKRESELAQLNFDVSAAKVKNTSILKVKKDELAVVKTILREKTLAEKLSKNVITKK